MKLTAVWVVPVAGSSVVRHCSVCQLAWSTVFSGNSRWLGNSYIWVAASAISVRSHYVLPIIDDKAQMSATDEHCHTMSEFWPTWAGSGVCVLLL